MRLTERQAELLRRWGKAFHQDVDLICERLEDAAVENLCADDQRRLRDLLKKLLLSCGDPELTGHLNRSGAQVFIKSKTARKLFESASDALQTSSA